MVRFDANQLQSQGPEAIGQNINRDFSHLDRTQRYPVETLIRFIREKGYGIDVRESIAKALERVYVDASQGGNTNMEIAQARGAYDTLSENLDNIISSLRTKANDSEIKMLINNIMDGTPKGTYSNLAALQSAKAGGDRGIYITTNNGHWNYWNGSRWVDGGPYQSPLDGVPNQFGVIFDGLLTIDRNLKTVTIKKDTWISFGNKNYAPKEDLSITYEPTGLSEYVVYDFQNSGLSMMTLSTIKNISSTQVILAIMYKEALHYPVNSRFVKTIGYAEYTQDSMIGSVVQGAVIYNNSTGTISFEGLGEADEIIVSKGTSYYTIKGHEDLQLSSGFMHHLILDVMDGKFKLIKSAFRTKGSTFTGKNTEILIASIYLGEITHYSNSNFVRTTKNLVKESYSLEDLIVDLQTKRTVLVTLGDSTTDGYRTSNYSNNQISVLAEKPKTYSHQLMQLLNSSTQNRFNHKVYNRGFSGKTINWLKNNLEAILEPINEKIDYATIAMGINDMVYDATKIAAFRNDHIAVISALMAKGIKPILMSTQSQFENYRRFGSKTNSIADVIKKDLAEEFNIPFIDYNAGTSNILNTSNYSVHDLIPDMCHFGDLGHKKGAEFLASQLISRCKTVDSNMRIGYQSNKVLSDLIYSDFQNDNDKQVKWISKTDNFDLEGQLNESAIKTMFEVIVYIEKPSRVRWFGENVDINVVDGEVLDVGLYTINVKNKPGQMSKFRGLKFELVPEV